MSDSSRRLEVRRATRGDAGDLAALVRGLASHEGARDLDHITEARVAEWCFGPDPVCEVLVAEQDDRLVGYLAYYRAFSLFQGGALMLVENIYVVDHARLTGAGRRLMIAAAGEAARRGWRRIELHVRNANAETRAFYERIGFVSPGESVYRIENEALVALAQVDRAQD